MSQKPVEFVSQVPNGPGCDGTVAMVAPCDHSHKTSVGGQPTARNLQNDLNYVPFPLRELASDVFQFIHGNIPLSSKLCGPKGFAIPLLQRTKETS